MNHETWNIKQKGFIAITSAIVISVLLLAIAFALSFSGFFARFNVLDSEYKNRSNALAEACVDKALLSLALNPSFGGNQTVTVDSATSPAIICEIKEVSLAGSKYTIYTKGEFPQTTARKAVSNLKVIVHQSNLSVVSWEELPAN